MTTPTTVCLFLVVIAGFVIVTKVLELVLAKLTDVVELEGARTNHEVHEQAGVITTAIEAASENAIVSTTGAVLEKVYTRQDALFGEVEGLLNERDRLERRVDELLKERAAAVAASAYAHLIGKTVIVNVRDGDAIRGVLLEEFEEAFTLGAPELLGQEIRPLAERLLLRKDSAPTIQHDAPAEA